MWVRGWDTELKPRSVADPRINGARAHVVNGVALNLGAALIVDPRNSGTRANVVNWVGHQSPCG